MFDQKRYLNRIGYTGTIRVDYETLDALQYRHLLTVPFENLDIHLGREIVLDTDRFYEKVVEERRGGFCYELNGLFARLLLSLGFSVTMFSAGVARKDGTFGPDYDHLTLLVQLSEPFLADVGFGDSFVRPVRFVPDQAQFDGRKYYRLVRDADFHILQVSENTADWTPEFRFKLIPRELSEYEGMCRYHQTSPESSFTQRRVCSRATDQGRITLTGSKRIVTVGSARTETDVNTPEEFAAFLRQDFGIVLPSQLQWK